MSRAKKTKRQKQYSTNNLYRHFTDVSNHAKNKTVNPEGKDKHAPHARPDITA